MATSRLTAKTIIFHRNATMSVKLSDGRTITVPLVWYPRLLKASASARRNWELCGAGSGIHWPDADEDLSIAGLLRGQPSPEYRKPRRRAKPNPPELRV